MYEFSDIDRPRDTRKAVFLVEVTLRVNDSDLRHGDSALEALRQVGGAQLLDCEVYDGDWREDTTYEVGA